MSLTINLFFMDQAEHEQHFLLLCQRADSADIVQFTYFLEKGVDPDIFDEVCYDGSVEYINIICY